MATNPNLSREETLKRVNALLTEVPDIASDEAIKRYLKTSGIDISKAQEQATMLVAKTIANRRLERAKAKRKEKLQILERIKSLASQWGASAAEQLKHLVESRDLEGAQMLARKFEQSHPEDTASLQEDLALLKEIDKDNGPDAHK